MMIPLWIFSRRNLFMVWCCWFPILQSKIMQLAFGSWSTSGCRKCLWCSNNCWQPGTCTRWPRCLCPVIFFALPWTLALYI
jgi:hypothetical protein